MLEPLGASQVLNYLKGLSSNYRFVLISFEKADDFKDTQLVRSLQDELMQYNIQWKPLEYKFGQRHYVSNLFKMYRQVRFCLKQSKIEFIHCRSYMAAILVRFIKKKDSKIKYLFDTRGFWFDEKADIGTWNRRGIIFKTAKRLEKSLYRKASAVVMLSQKSIDIIKNDQLFKGSSQIDNVYFIPTCTDLKKFVPNLENKNPKLKIGYIGSVGGWYNFEKTAELLKYIKKELDYDLEIYNGTQHKFINSILNEYGFSNDDYTLQKIAFEHIPQKMKNLDISVFFIHPYFSKNASAATKFGELMACGVPVLTNKNVGDHEYFVNDNDVGKLLDIEKLEEYDYKKIIASLTTLQVRINCRKLAESTFSLEGGIKRYMEIYENIINYK